MRNVEFAVLRRNPPRRETYESEKMLTLPRAAPAEFLTNHCREGWAEETTTTTPRKALG